MRKALVCPLLVMAACSASHPDSDPAEDPQTSGDELAAGACADRNPLKNPYFGDLHSHTSFSGDAYTFDTRNTPLDAYAFARGKTLQIAGAGPNGGGPLATIERPLDFLAVTDHSEFLAAAYGCGADLHGKAYDATHAIFDTPTCKALREAKSEVLQIAAVAAVLKKTCANGACDGVVKSAWQHEQQAAAAANQKCKFTSFVAYEWTKVIDGNTLHKNVIFGSDKVPAAPFDSVTYDTQEALWSALASGCDSPNGCDALTNPHNSNLSAGLAFEVPTAPADLARMQRYQRLVEIFQHKGGSECMSPDDPECKFEQLPDHATDTDKPGYVRQGLEKGLAIRASSGSNPLALGFVGGTDDHNGTPGNTNETGWPGHLGSNDDGPAKRISPHNVDSDIPLFNPGGLTVAWAEENSRASIFAALQRRETYATSGVRMVVRFYATRQAGDPCADPKFPAAIVANGGVPMGGTFSRGSGAPRFVVRAWQDRVPLARIDIVKAWVDADGAVEEKVVQTNVGGATACLTWDDPDPAPGAAFYYARVLEAPTPRWSVADCKAAPLANREGCVPGGSLNRLVQERAWTSPIWQEP